MKKIFLILSFLFITGCKCDPQKIDEFPAKKVFMVDVNNWVCAEYKIVDPKSLKFSWVKDHPIQKCQDVTGFDKQDFTATKNWVRDLQGNVKAAMDAALMTMDEILSE